MSNIKSLGEEMLHLLAKSNKLDEAIHLLKSTENTLAEDILALIEGAKLECKVDINKINGYLEEIDNYRYDAEDNVASAECSAVDARYSVRSMEDEINGLRNYLSDLKWEIKEEDKE